MIACHCQALTDSDIICAIVDGALTVSDIAKATLATTDCGSCKDLIQELLGESNYGTSKRISKIRKG